MNALKPHSFALTPGKAATLIALLGWLAYANSLTKAFMLDDYPWILENDAIGDIWTNTLNNPQRPLAALTVSVNYRIGGFEPAGYHVLNIAIHIGAALALFGTVRRVLILPRWQRRWESGSTAIAFAAASLWVVHPLNTHAVTYLIQRCESGMGLGYILTLYCLVRGSQSPRAVVWNLGAIAAAWFSLGFKEVAVTILPVALLFDRVFLADSWKQLLARRWYVYLGLAGVFVPPILIHFTPIWSGATTHDVTIGFEVPNLDPKSYFLTECGVLVHYLRLALWPAGLCFDYFDWPAPKTVLDWLPAFAFLTIAFLACTIGLFFRNGFAFLGMSMFLTLSITSSFIPIADVANEYRMYVPLMALTTAVAVFGSLMLERFCPASLRTYVGGGLLAACLAVLTTLTYLRNEDYRTLQAMWEDVVRKRPGNYRAYESLAFAHEREGRWDAARENHLQALKILPGALNASMNLALLDYHEGRPKEAIAALKLVEEYARTHPETSATRIGKQQLGMFLHLEGDSPAALATLAAILAKEPNRPIPRLFYAQVLADTGRRDDAAAEFHKTKQLAPDVGMSQRKQIQAMLRGRMGDAVQVRREALFRAKAVAATSPPDDAASRALLADALAWNGRTAEAAEELRTAIALTSPETPTRRSLEAKLKSWGK
jgi:tetratricopeptide (TPR) repeat protein